jgi:hypothetical protein
MSYHITGQNKKLAFKLNQFRPKNFCGGVRLSRIFVRLSIAAALSLGCYGLTEWWYRSTEKKIHDDSNQKPIAHVSETQDEINRRPVTRLLWQVVSDGDPLYPGEALRTSSAGKAKIQFVDSDRSIDVEADSLIVLNLSENEISLDLMDGSFMVNQGASGESSKGPTLSLNSGSGKVDLSQATANLSKSTQGIELQVIKGKAKIQDSSGKTKEIESGKRGALGTQGIASFQQEYLQIISPSIDRPFFINPESVQPVTFQWRGFPANSTVTLQTGVTRKDLKPRGETTTGKYSLEFKPGRYFWRLVAKDKTSQQVVGESNTYKLEVSARLAPSAMSPENKAVLPRSEPQLKVEFHWVRPEQANSVSLEVWRDPGLQNRLYSKIFTKEEAIALLLPDGDYYWRVAALYDGVDKPINGKLQNFNVIAFEKTKPQVFIGWQQPEDKGPQFFIDQPTASLAWTTAQRDQVKSWRVRLGTSEEEMNSDRAKVFETVQFSAKTPVAKPGRYIAMVEALDEQKQVIAKSPIKGIEIAPLPLLPPPRFEPRSGDLQADNQGRVNLQWNAIEGAKEYHLTLFDRDGRELKSAKYTKSTAALGNLLPGTYRVSVLAIDQHGRKSPQNPPRNVIVPDTSGLNAPKLKAIKVK